MGPDNYRAVLDLKNLVFFLGSRLKLVFIGWIRSVSSDGSGRFFIGLGLVGFSSDWIWSVFHWIGSGRFFIGLDLVSSSLDWIWLVFFGPDGHREDSVVFSGYGLSVFHGLNFFIFSLVIRLL